MTGAMSRRKGATYALTIRRWFEARGWQCIARQAGEDGDDLILLDAAWLSIEIKNQARLNLAGWMTQAINQAAGRTPIVIHKRHGITNPEYQWVTLRLADFEALIRARDRVS